MKTLILFLRWWWLWLICVILCAFPAALLLDRLGWIEFEYEAQAVIRIQPILDVDPGLGRSSGLGPSIQRSFTNTAFGDFLFSPETIQVVLEDHSLLSQLGGDPAEAMKRLSKGVTTQSISASNQVEVLSKSHDPELARDQLIALIAAYSKRRSKLEMSVRRNQRKAMRIEIENKEARVDVLRKRLKDRIKKMNEVWDGERISSLSEQHHKKLNQLEILEFNNARKEYQMAKSILEQMKKKYAAEKVNMAPTNNVVMIKSPELPKHPVGYRSYMRAGIAALPISGLLGFFLMKLADQRFPRKSSNFKLLNPTHLLQ